MAIEQVTDLIEQGGKRGIQPGDTTRELCLVPGRKDRMTKIGTEMSVSTELGLTALLRRNLDVFAWSTRDLVGIDPEVMVHSLNIDP